jgi:5-methyltetrahydropteroyltriglutamate--homocysteine methyltransferase
LINYFSEKINEFFLLFRIAPLYPSSYSFDDIIDCFTITFSDGHQRSLPRLIKAPFQYGKYAVDYVRRAQKYTHRPIKQAVISPSALSNVYPRATIIGYSREQFLDDLVNESEKDIRLCLEAGVDKVQMDFTEARLSLKIDPTGQLLKNFIQLNNRVLDRFRHNPEYYSKLGVHICPGNSKEKKKFFFMFFLHRRRSRFSSFIKC